MLARNGAAVSDTARPGFSSRDHHVTYQSLLRSITGSGVPDEIFEQNKRLAADFGATDMSGDAIRARASVLDHRAWLAHNNLRTRIRMQWQQFFEDWDIVICPIMVTTAFPHDHRPFPERTLRVNGVDTPYFDQVFWAGLATLAYLPSTVFPTGLSGDGLPIGLQAIGAEFHDRTTIEFARLMAQEMGGFTPPAGYGD